MKFLDIGAHKGTYSMMVASMVGPSGKVVAIEPKSENCEAFCKAVKTNNYEDIITLHQCALSSKKEIVSLSQKGTHIVNGTFDDESVFEVEARTIDGLIDEYGIFDLIKIDTDGHELDIIKGSESALKRGDVNKLLVEVSLFDYQSMDNLLEGLRKIIEPYGFSTHVLDYSGRLNTFEETPTWHKKRELHVVFSKL